MKLVVAEPGSAGAESAWLDADRRVSSLLLYAEARAAVGRARRVGRLQDLALARASARIEELWPSIDRVAVTEQLTRDAGDLAESHGLRGYDAVHLASALSLADADVILVAADRELLAAARERGLGTVAL